MYVTRPLSVYQNYPSATALPPPEGPNGGYLVLQDDASTSRTFFGMFKDTQIKDFPFPQNKRHVVTHGSGKDRSYYPVYFIPVINRPLSSNVYYVIKAKKHTGKACTSSSDEDMTFCCFGNCINNVDPKALDPTNTYQQFMVSKNKSWYASGFLAASVAHDGHPPFFLRSKGWGLFSKTPKNFSLGEAKGMDLALRTRLPDFNFSASYKAYNSVVVGKWYCPFMLIKDQLLTPKEQVKNSMYYEMTLEQQWDRVFYCENEGSKDTLFVDVAVPNESVMVAKMNAIQLVDQHDGLVWFSAMDGTARTGLSSLIVERMKWEEGRVGWVSNEGNQGKVLKIEEFGGLGKWERYGSYILVERFVLKRMDGTVILTYSFNHTHQIRSKWE